MFALVIGCANEKLKGPTTVNQSTPIPMELLSSLDSSSELSSTPQTLPISTKVLTSIFSTFGRTCGNDELKFNVL